MKNDNYQVLTLEDSQKLRLVEDEPSFDPYNTADGHRENTRLRDVDAHRALVATARG